MCVASPNETLYRASFFFESLDNPTMSSYAFPLGRPADLRALCRSKTVWFSQGDERVMERLELVVIPLIEEEATAVERIPGFTGESGDLPGRSCKERLASSPPDLIVLAERGYQDAFSTLCSLLTQPVPVVLPTGYVLLGAPGAMYAQQRAAVTSYPSLESMLAAFRGKSMLLWNHGPAARYALLPALRALGMGGDVIGMVDEDEARQGQTLEGYAVVAPEEGLRRGGFDVVLAASDAADAAFAAVHGKIPDFTPLLIHRPRAGVIEAFQPLAFAHSMFAGPDGILAHKAIPEPLVLFTRRQYDRLYKEHPNFSDQHFEEISPFGTTVMSKCGFFPADKQSRFVNCSGGQRRTAFQPEDWTNRIFLYGPCHTYGAYEDDEHTVASALQRLCNENTSGLPGDKVYKVENFGAIASSTDNCYRKFMGQEIASGDVIILLTGPYWLKTRQEETIRLCSAMHQRCLRHGARFAMYVGAELGYVANPSEDEKQLIQKYILLTGEIYHESTYPAWKETHGNVIRELQNAGVYCRSLQPAFERPHGMGEVFVDAMHVTYKGFQRIAEIIFQEVSGEPASLEEQAYRESLLAFSRIVRDFAVAQDSFLTWLDAIPRPPANAEIIGAICINANPFTFGHRYLVEQALREVDYLYLFVVEEDRSYFSTSTRLAMTEAGIADLADSKRILLLTSGPWQVSSFTFPEYFSREKGVTYLPDVTIEGLMFSFLLAPSLGINVRYFGDEPTCVVTREYQRQIEVMLSLADIRSRTFPRFQQDGVTISASHVRSLIQAKNYKDLTRLVPQGTLEFFASGKGDDSPKTAERPSHKS